MPGEETIAGLVPTAVPSARANSRWVQPSGLPSSASTSMFDGRRVSGEREQQPREVVDVDHRHAALGRHQHEAELGHPEQLERLLVAGAVDRGRADDHPVEAGAVDQLLGPRLGRAVERQFGLARGERGDVDEAAHPAGGRRGEHRQRAGDIAELERRRRSAR